MGTTTSSPPEKKKGTALVTAAAAGTDAVVKISSQHMAAQMSLADWDVVYIPGSNESSARADRDATEFRRKISITLNRYLGADDLWVIDIGTYADKFLDVALFAPFHNGAARDYTDRLAAYLHHYDISVKVFVGTPQNDIVCQASEYNFSRVIDVKLCSRQHDFCRFIVKKIFEWLLLQV